MAENIINNVWALVNDNITNLVVIVVNENKKITGEYMVSFGDKYSNRA